ncbi:copper amine oxidase N-terminal domain-containing protein [Paenibacillus aceti]|uniref:Copper amine oxidase-like N-terminal domain-containing protein n=1 Tax=Paenibacillus aceti TaxID=1820010 RepID=A0ABQ1W562_9BACL|nr:copper amine oxidase N-terminal domain-containing protein [Paenibacillus aceti]GGG13478.1 hypothetical protein GCM10010913_39070 [Paenibacillus aceti]
MLKKMILSILASALLAISAISTSSFASFAAVKLDNGKLQNNRVLIPLRDVSQHLGARVEWESQDQLITIIKDDTTIQLRVNSNQVQVNEAEVMLDVPAQLDHGGTTYVPLRFVSQTLGADVNWDQKLKQAAIALEDKEIVISMKVEPPSAAQKATMIRLQQLADKLNEANDISTMKQVREYFQPYFTDKFINLIIKDKGLQNKYEFKDLTSPAFYTSMTTGRFSQAIDIGRNEHGNLVTMTRQAQLVNIDGLWKIDSVVFKKDEIPVSGV